MHGELDLFREWVLSSNDYLFICDRQGVDSGLLMLLTVDKQYHRFPRPHNLLNLSLYFHLDQLPRLTGVYATLPGYQIIVVMHSKWGFQFLHLA